MARKRVATPAMKVMLKNSGSHDPLVAGPAQRELAIALELPLKKGVLNGSITDGIFEEITFEPGVATEFPLDFLSPGTERNFIAYTIPFIGALPQHNISGDSLMVPTYETGSTIDWALKYARDARWDIVGRAMDVLEGSFVRKRNKDAWSVLLRAALSRNLIPYDDMATAGLFTKRLVEIMKQIMRRNAGGNSSSTNKGKLTDLFISPEAQGDMFSWDLTQIPEAERSKIFNNGPLLNIADVNLHAIDELGVGQDFQRYWTNTLAGTMPTDKVEIVVGLDLSTNDSFVRPIKEELSIFEDASLHKQRRAGVYAWEEGGWSALDNRRTLVGAL